MTGKHVASWTKFLLFCLFAAICSCNFTNLPGSLEIKTIEDVFKIASDDDNCKSVILINRTDNQSEWESYCSKDGTKTDLSAVSSGMVMLHTENSYILGFEKDSDVQLSDISPFFHQHKSLEKIDFGDIDLKDVKTYSVSNEQNRSNEPEQNFLDGTEDVTLVNCKNLKFKVVYSIACHSTSDHDYHDEEYTYSCDVETPLWTPPERDGQYQFTNWFESEDELKNNPADLDESKIVSSISKSEYGVKRFYGQFNKYAKINLGAVEHLTEKHLYKNEIEYDDSEISSEKFFPGDEIAIRVQTEDGFMIPLDAVKINGVPIDHSTDNDMYSYTVSDNPDDLLNLVIDTKQYVEYNNLAISNCSVNITCGGSPVSKGSKFNVGDIIVLNVVPSSGYAINDSKSDSILIAGQVPTKVAENMYQYSITGNEALLFDISVACEKSWTHTLSSTKCVLSVMRNGSEVSAGTPLFNGDNLVLDIRPEESYETQSVLLNGEPLSATNGIYQYGVTSGSAPTLNFAVVCVKYTKLNLLEYSDCTVDVKRNGIAVTAADSLYAGDVLNITITPDPNYIVDLLQVGGNTLLKTAEWVYSYIITGSEPEKLDMTVQTKKYITLDMSPVSNGSVKVYRGATEVNSTEKLFKGNQIKIVVTPDSYYYTKSIVANSHSVSNQNEFQFSLNDSDMAGLKLAVSVIVENYHTLSITKTSGASVKITNKNGNEIANGASVYNGDVISVKLQNPDDYYTRTVSINGGAEQEFTSSNNYTVSFTTSQSDSNVISIAVVCLDYRDYSFSGFTISNVKPYLANATEFTVAAASLWTSVTSGVGDDAIRLCKEGTKVYLLLGNNVSKIEETSYSQLFKGFSSLKVLDLSKLSFNSCTNVHEMFSGCSSLETIYVLAMPSSPKYNNSTGTFTGCTNLSGKYNGGSCVFNPSKIDGLYARLASSNSSQFGYFTRK